MKLPAGTSRARSHARSRWRRVSAILAALAVAASVWALQPAQPKASAGLRSAQPALSAHVGGAPQRVQLSFGQPAVPGPGTKVSVLGPDDENLARGSAVPSPDGISQTLARLPERGAYQVAYEVRLLDGEVASGQYWFWYAPTTSGSISRLEFPALLGLLVALAAALAAGLLAPGRRRQHPLAVPAQRSGSPSPTTRAHPVPTQRNRDSHDGISPPRSPPRARPASRPPPDEQPKPVPPRNL